MKTKNTMPYFSYLLPILLFLSLFFFACQRKNKTNKSPKKAFRTCLITDLATVDTRKNADVFSSSVNFLIYEGLTRILPNGEIEWALAESADISEDGCTYTFHLRDAYWSDGYPITAHDFEYSWKKTLDPEFASPCSQIFFPIKNGEKCAKREVSLDFVGIKAINSSTLKIELEHPTPYFLSLVTFCNFYPIPKHIELSNPHWAQTSENELVSSGPFCLKKWTRNKEIILTKNPTYWDAANVYLEEINFSIIPDERTALQMFENGELDFISTVTTPLCSEDLAAMRKKNLLRVIPMSGLLFCTFNLDRYPYQNTHLRKALSHAIDRSALVESISQLSEEPATRCIPPVMVKQKNTKLFPPFDPKLAQDFFNQALSELNLSLSDINSMNHAFILSYTNVEPYRKIAETIQEQWKMTLGLEVTIEERDDKSHLFNIMDKNYCIALYNCIAQCTDPTNILDRFKYKNGKKNYPGFQNEEYIQLLERASILIDPMERASLLDEAEALLMSYMPISPIYHFHQGVLINPDFTDIEFSPLSNLLLKKVKSIYMSHANDSEENALNSRESQPKTPVYD